MVWTEQEITKKCQEICAGTGHTFNIPVTINKRLRTTLGRVKNIRTYDNYVPVLMEFSYQFITTNSYENVVDIIKHECAHYLVAIETHEHHGHDAVFKAMCAKIGCTNSGYRANFEKDENTYKYLIICPSCNKVVAKYRRAGKAVKNPHLYKCNFCGSDNLEVKQNW